MYERHFGLAKAPFRITPDPEFFFSGGNRGAVLEALIYATARGEGIVKVVGEVGSGKTMLCRMLERELPADCEIVYVANPRLYPDAVLHAIASELGLVAAPEDSKLKVLHAVQDYLLARHAAGKRVVMFIEEAQAMPVETLEEIRLLSNLETTQAKLLQIVLFGQPELDDKLALHEIRQLRERITHGFHLTPLNREQIRDYLLARLRASGYRGEGLFAPAAIRAIERASRGLLRRINVLADKALLAAYADQAAGVDASHVRRAVADSEFGAEMRGVPRWWPALLLLPVLGGLLWLLSNEWEFLPRGAASAPTEVAAAASAPKVAVSPAAPPSATAASAPASPAQAAADAAPYPRVSADTGLVGLEHLMPAELPAPDTRALLEKWGGRPQR
ncbi:MAG: AAA family ATPase [Gammaproteobacteria bacterium]|nr:AAA family ATPase [Gammaproteobacteria bacterium]